MNQRDPLEIFNDALELTPEDREEYLDRRCGDDEELRRDVESLLDLHERVPARSAALDPSIAESATTRFQANAPSSLPLPSRIGRYEVLGEVGHGGMGTVFRAKDPELGREIALKIIPPHLVRAPQRLSRFRREAKLLAKLSHVNIATVHSLEFEGDTPFLTMELVLGEDLSDRLARGALDVSTTLAIGRQIASALGDAHRQGVIHRDLKPANVMLAPGDLVKVLDFGLAKEVRDNEEIGTSPAVVEGTTTRTNDDHETGHDPSRQSSRSSFLGSFLGSPGYMSPEQLTGAAVGTGADIWATGCILFECLAAERAFPGATVGERVRRCLEGEPNWSAIPERTPDPVVALIRTCLNKEPRSRPGSASHLEDVLRSLQSDAGTPKRSLPILGSSRTTRLGAVLTALSAIVILAWQLFHREDGSAGLSSPRQITFAGAVQYFSLSPDEERIVLTERDGSIAVQKVGEATRDQVLQLGFPLGAVWSPDGSEFAVTDREDGRETWILSADGKRSRILDVDGFSVNDWPSPRTLAGTYLNRRNDERVAVEVDIPSGETTRLEIPDGLRASSIRRSRDGAFRLVDSRDPRQKKQLWLVSADAKIVRHIEGAIGGGWLAQPNALWVLGGDDSIRFMDLDSRLGTLRENRRVATQEKVLFVGSGGQRAYSLASTYRHTLWQIENPPGAAPTYTVVDSWTGRGAHPRLSPDGESVAFLRASRIVVRRLEDGLEYGISVGQSVADSPSWSPSGDRIAFCGVDGDRRKLWIADTDTHATHELPDSDCYGFVYWRPSHAIYYQPTQHKSHDFAVLDPESGQQTMLLGEKSMDTVFQAATSPDGHWIAVAGNRGENPDVRVWRISLDDRTEKLLYDGHAAPVAWSRDSQWLYIVTEEVRPSEGESQVAILRVPVEGGDAESVVEFPRGDIARFADVDVNEDGTRIVGILREVHSDVFVYDIDG